MLLRIIATKWTLYVITARLPLGQGRSFENTAFTKHFFHQNRMISR